MEETTITGLLDLDGGKMSESRIARFETLRKESVPRFLFRAWSNKSGGGPSVSVNSTKEIIPPAFVKNPNATYKFYEQTESALFAMVEGHYNGHRTPLTQFSSWASSLHLVLCYADTKLKSRFWRRERDVHIAVIDTHSLDDEVLVWHVPQLISASNHEYLAHGCIRGRGYKAVPFKHIQKMDLYQLFPEISGRRRHHFGWQVREDMFEQESTCISDSDYKIIRKIASLFDGLFLPVAVALICIRPRPWIRTSSSDGEITAEQIESIFERMWWPPLRMKIEENQWLMLEGTVDTFGFNDVEQWMDLLRSMVSHAERNKKANQKNC